VGVAGEAGTLEGEVRLDEFGGVARLSGVEGRREGELFSPEVSSGSVAGTSAAGKGSSPELPSTEASSRSPVLSDGDGRFCS